MRKLKVLLLLLIPITIFAQDTDPDDEYNIIFSQDFDHHSAPVEYVYDLQSPDWNNHTWFDSDHRWPAGWAANPAIKDSIVIDPLSGSNVNKQSFDDAIIDGYDGQGSTRGGENFNMSIGSEPKEVYLSYNMMLRPGWLPSGGGKFPGMASTNYQTSDPPPRDGFKADLAWAWTKCPCPPGFYNGLSWYVSHYEMPGQYSQIQDFRDFQPIGKGLQYYSDGRFYFDVTTEKWYNITLRFVCNTFSGTTPDHNGILEGYINGHLISQWSGLVLINRHEDIGYGIGRLWFNNSFGGGGPPLRDEWVLFDDIVVFTYDEAIDVPRGNELSPPGRVLDLPNLEKVIPVDTMDINIPTMPVLPDVSIIDVKNTNIPNIAISEAKISFFGQTEIIDYGLTVTKSEEPIADELIILSSQDYSTIWNSERASRGLKALYVFDEGEGNQILDNSGTDPHVNLEIQNTSATTWLPGRGLKVEGNSIIATNDVPTELINSIISTNEITLEAWIKSGDINQSGPARIISLSENTQFRAFTLGQIGDQANYKYIVRLNTTNTTANGEPQVLTANDFVNLNLHHVVYTRNSNGEEKIYINGQETYSGMRGGDFSSMGNDYFLTIANEMSGDRPWNGTYYLLGIYNQALNMDEINMNFTAGLGEIRFTTNMLVEPNVTYLVTPFARTDRGVIYGNTEVLRPWSNATGSPFEDQVKPYHSIDK